VCEIATGDGGFRLAWGGLVDEAGARIVPLAASGPAIEYVDGLVISMDPVLPTGRGPAARCIREKKIIHVDDFQTNSDTQVWRELGEKFGIHSSAAVPVIVENKGLGCLNFYSGEKGFFDEEFRGLLEEVGRNVSLACHSVQARAERAEALARRDQVELRLGSAIEASPIPIQIYSLTTRRLLLMNKAHRRVIGYSMEEIPDDVSFFDKVNVAAGPGEQMKKEWERCIEDAVRGGPDFVVTSPEIELRARDGSIKVGRAYVSVVDDEIIVQWLDLTGIRKAQAELVENERHFRGMIEQSLTGIFVIQYGKVVYVNPRLAEIIGWAAEEMLGRDFLEVISNLPGSREKLLAWSSRVESGERNMDESIAYRCRDGREIILGIHGNQGVWDGRLATVVMSQDITERQRAEEKIANYVKQLEGSMRGTLQAVANMVDLRDPYTAGHERRVGLVAAALAREMGWSEERCQNLELIGLVHDIGKIAVPAEILSKPTKLTKLEFDMVKIHAEKGFEILKDVEFPLPIAEIIREHHERLDGSGYPQGLKGDAILPEARVLAVADVLESMASHRPYRPALGIEVAIKEIEGHRGVWFDDAVVDAMLRLVREKGYQLPA
jgi:PAS domain S-box-containing protein/putative nucleotidyltransferase with HDIG domain